MERSFLILEDNDYRIGWFIQELKKHGKVNYFRHAKECFEFLKNNPNQDMIFLDHDLNDEIYVSTKDEDTGSGFCRMIKEDNELNDQIRKNNPIIIVHTENSAAAPSMMNFLTQQCTLTNVFQISFSNLKNIFHKIIKFH